MGPRPALPAEVATYDDYQRQRLLVKPGLTCYWQTRRNRDSITFDEWVDLDLWDARTVLRILSNETYAGTLVQGKTCKPDFRRKAVLPVDESEWDRSPGAHEAIVDPATFGLVRKLARRDMRLSPGAKRSLPLSGFLFCADCGATMARHASRRSSGKRFYYSCETHRKNRAECGMHKVWEDELSAAVMRAVHGHALAAVDGDGAVRGAEAYRHDRRAELACLYLIRFSLHE